MKKSKIIIPALAMLAMSTAATVTGTVAWFSMNKTVTAEGMLVRAQGQGSIVISKFNANDANKGRPQQSTRTTGVDFTELDNENHKISYGLFPTTHDSTFATYTHGLKYVNNGNIICYETGTPKNSSSTISWARVTTATDYFKDYDLFIGGDGQSFSGQDVKVSFGTLANNIANINKAISIDIYAAVVDEHSNIAFSTAEGSKTFWGTLNVAGMNATTNNATVLNPNQVVISNVNIPQSGSATSLAVKLRVYYDGALIDHVGTYAYTDYTACDDDETVEDYPSSEYFYNASGDIMLAKTYSDSAHTNCTNLGASVKGLYVVNTNASTTTYARSVDYFKLDDVALNVVFTAEAHPQNNG